MKVVDGAAALRSSTELFDGVRVFVQSCEWRAEKGRELGPIVRVGASVGPEVNSSDVNVCNACMIRPYNSKSAA